jgi:hypothetical protein
MTVFPPLQALWSCVGEMEVPFAALSLPISRIEESRIVLDYSINWDSGIIYPA